jgi:ATP-binding cassette subfamily B protein
MNAFTKRRFLVPEVVQTSAMDCGPASLKCLLEGFGKKASYGRLREVCQTDVDGTSIDTIEETAVQLGLDAEQIMLPVNHLLLPEAQALPAIVVVRLPDGNTHFVVAWSCHGGFVQVMDPATGRRWPRWRRFLDELYVHVLPVPAATWRNWAGSQEFIDALCRRLTSLDLSKGPIETLVATGLADPTWHSIAALHAAVEMTASIARSGGLRGAKEAERVLLHLFKQSREEQVPEDQLIPAQYWPVLPTEPDAAELLLRGAVIVRVRGPRAGGAEVPAPDAPTRTIATSSSPSPELMAALEEPPSRPLKELLQSLRTDGLLRPVALAAALFVAASGRLVEIALFRAFLDLGRDLGLTDQRLEAMGALVLFVGALLLLELPVAAAALSLGRQLDGRLRVAFFEKLTRLSDRYFQSRPTSDMAHRSHSVHALRLLPGIGADILKSAFELILTAAGIVWLDPASTWLVILAATLGIGLPLLAQPVVAERELRARTHAGALSIFYLDALLGIVPVRTHGAERTVRRAHGQLLLEWTRASTALQRAVIGVEAVELITSFGFAVWLLFDHLERFGETGTMLLFAYWALNLPFLGQAVALAARQYPIHRNIALRLLEPLGAPEESPREACSDPMTECTVRPARGVAFTFEEIGVTAAGHEILSGISLTIEAGSQLAILGPSGAGKSSLVSLLLGWHRPTSGKIRIDGAALDGRRLERLRRETAWVDPAIQLWNRSLLDNLQYGARVDGSSAIGQVTSAVEIRLLLDKLPDGLQTALGEGGGLISGGEGQRVRLGRAMLRSNVRLVILDEPFRGLDRDRRRELLMRCRALWEGATLLCVTHDVGETTRFDHVVLMEGGRIVESGAPGELSRREGSRYRALLAAEKSVRAGLWTSADWRRLRLDGGQLKEGNEVR